MPVDKSGRKWYNIYSERERGSPKGSRVAHLIKDLAQFALNSYYQAIG